MIVSIYYRHSWRALQEKNLQGNDSSQETNLGLDCLSDQANFDWFRGLDTREDVDRFLNSKFMS